MGIEIFVGEMELGNAGKVILIIAGVTTLLTVIGEGTGVNCGT